LPPTIASPPISQRLDAGTTTSTKIPTGVDAIGYLGCEFSHGHLVASQVDMPEKAPCPLAADYQNW